MIWSSTLKKCKLMRITKKKNPIARNFFINGSELELVNEFKDLGLLTDNILSWNQHVNKITARANKLLGLISRTCGGFQVIQPPLKPFIVLLFAHN